ncbi:uncharacterized protein BO72DRAFT_455261 [Aspergillus fijiensis CBS 313.89]|uniref:Uncharacterized protein n=1 Tax=Aspergillus fijiensis CBS 313.89 TaxID=1448319 RepID=A0A8G1W2B8_9EURO|nr:uncharacterized protein BO72DRAFT_455261 [Aspergillus fijiensis CBS 313.89]RAK81347.1 hypothetical protein BO72DRAFT_455261 [Aspergillus fijiensis CBS 313.89]
MDRRPVYMTGSSYLRKPDQGPLIDMGQWAAMTMTIVSRRSLLSTMITNLFAKAAATGGNQSQDGAGPVVDSLLGARTSVPPTGHRDMDVGLLVIGDVQDSPATPKTPNKSRGERPQVSPTRDHGKSEAMHLPYDSFYPEDQENWDWGVMIPSKPRPRSKYAESLRPDWMKRDVNEAQVSKSIVEDVANDEEEFFDWSSSPPRPGRREAEEGLEKENIESELLDTDEFPLRRPNESHEKYVYRVLNLELDDVEA